MAKRKPKVILPGSDPDADLVVPPGKKTGCEYRITYPGEVCDMYAEKLEVIPRDKWAKFISQGVALRPYVWQVLDQDGVGSCFPANTRIQMKDGSEKVIESLNVLDIVRSAEGNAQIVTHVMARWHNGEVVQLDVETKSPLRVTPEHPILVENRYIPAREVAIGDYVSCDGRQDNPKRVTGKSTSHLDAWVFNLEVENDNSYIANGIGVHNCATESTTQAVHIIREWGGQNRELLNPWSIYRVTSGGSDRGSNIDRNCEFARDVGILPEAYWPRSNGWRRRPPSGWEEVAKQYRISEFYDITDQDSFGSALLLGFPVVWGWQGHSVVATDLIDDRTFRYCNSWGNWGDKGFGTLRLSKINWGYGAFAVRTVTEGRTT